MASESPGNQGVVFKNTLILVGARLAGAPLSMLVSACMGRYLGAAAFGKVYLAGTLATFGFLLVEWGQSGVLPAEVARDRRRAGELLGSALAWRTVAALLVYCVLSLACLLLGYGAEFQIIFSLVFLQYFAITVATAFQDTARGFERTDITAYAQVGGAVGSVLFVIPVLLLGGKLISVLCAQALTSIIVAIVVSLTARRVGVGRLRLRAPAIKTLVTMGGSFLVFSFTMALQPNIDALFLSKMTSSEVIGWQAAAQRLMGVLMMPAGALVPALYPTLSRLFVEDPDEYRRAARRAVQGTLTFAIPMALCCAFFRDVGIQIFSRRAFGPAAQNLLVMSALIFLLYFSMPIGTAILAAGRQRVFTVAQSVCIVVSLCLDPLLIPLFQRRYGNGGLGVCVAGVVSEVLVVCCALFLVPRGVLDRAFARAVGKGIAAGVAMAAVAYALRSVTAYLVAPLSLSAYVGCLLLLGGVDRQQLEAVRRRVARKLQRAQA